MSMPEETPAAVTYLPSNTTRSPVGTAPSAGSWSRASQWDAARRPVSSPAAARMRVLARSTGHYDDVGAGHLGKRRVGAQGEAAQISAPRTDAVADEDGPRARQPALSRRCLFTVRAVEGPEARQSRRNPEDRQRAT
ncbi:MAG: enoyl-CoA hydratase [Dactylosporangium sp.]|jgi:hypothetical protein|nr:enoyl-CoA hydratase [Dactylosporangium sp.]